MKDQLKYNLSKYNWVLRNKPNASINEEAGRNYSPAFLRLLASRGITTSEELEKQIDSHPTLFHDPFLLYDMEKAVSRIREAIESQEIILIYGDYDADGITSTLIIFETLSLMGANVRYYLPDRFIDGYGPNLEKYQVFIDDGVHLIITCDNGVSGHEAIEYANHSGVDVIVTDHHQIKETIPNAYAVIHPQHPNGNYPFKDLSGAGVALKLVTALIEEVPEDAIELAMIGTIADMVSLNDENRTIVISGLNHIKYSERIGIIKLCENLDIPLNQIDADIIGFQIGPRLNSTGRLAGAELGLQLLLTTEEKEAETIINKVEALNNQRRKICEEIYTDVSERLNSVESLPDIIIEAASEWHPGVLGIVASRILNTYHRPVILFHYDATTKTYKGSARSSENVNIFKLLSSVSENIKYFGGHGQAAGMTIEASQWGSFKKHITLESSHIRNQIIKPTDLIVDIPLSIEDVTVDFFDEIEQLGPFGMGNPKPKFLFDDVVLKQKRIIGNQGQHIKLITSDDTMGELTVIGFSKAEQCKELNESNNVSMVGSLNKNEWNQKVSIQLQLEDIGIKGIQWIDCRQSKVDMNLINIKQSISLFKHKKILKHYAEKTLKSNLFLYDDLQDRTDFTSINTLIIFEPPSDIESLKYIINQSQWSKIYLASYIIDSKYLIGTPSRQEMKRLYTWLFNQKKVNVKGKLNDISQLLDIHPTKLKLLIKMYLEANFVTIHDGWIKFNHSLMQNSQKVDLTTLDIYQDYVKEMKIEELLNYKPIEEIKKVFEGKI